MTPARESWDEDGVVEVELGLKDRGHPFVMLSEELDCTVKLERMLPRNAGVYSAFYSVENADPDEADVVVREADGIQHRLVDRNGSESLFEFVVDDSNPVIQVSELGAIPQDVYGVNGHGRIELEVLPEDDATQVIEEFMSRNPDAELLSKHEQQRRTPIFSERELQHAMQTCLTERQAEVLEAAYKNGYYESPRGKSGKEIADELDISQPTFSQHLRAAERQMLSMLYNEDAPRPSA